MLLEFTSQQFLPQSKSRTK